MDDNEFVLAMADIKDIDHAICNILDYQALHLGCTITEDDITLILAALYYVREMKEE